MLDLNKLRARAKLPERTHGWMAVPPGEILELLDALEAAQKDVEIVNWLQTQSRVCIERVREGKPDGPLRYDVEYGHDDKGTWSKESLRAALRKAVARTQQPQEQST